MQSDLLDVVIGVVFFWFLLSMVLAAVHEGLSLISRIRAKHLWLGIGRLFEADLPLLPRRLSDIALRLPFSGGLEARPRVLPPNPGTTGVEVALAASAVPTPVNPVRGVAEVLRRSPAARQQLDVASTVRPKNELLYEVLAPRITEVAKPGRLSKITQIAPEIYSAAVIELARRVFKADLIRVADEVGWPTAKQSWLSQALGSTPDTSVVQLVDFVGLAPSGLAPGAGAPTTDELTDLYTRASESVTLRDLAALYEANPALVDAIKRAVAAVGVGEQISKARSVVETWFEREMDQLSQIYRRQSRKILAVLAIPLVLFAHANTITMYENLRSDQSLRQAAIIGSSDQVAADLAVCPAAEAEEPGEDEDPAGSTTSVPAPTTTIDGLDAVGDKYECARDALGRASQFRIGLAWQDLKNSDGETGKDAQFELADLKPYLGDALFDDWGYLGRGLTLIALMFGAQFWFDALRRLMGLRNALGGATGAGASG